MSKFEVEGLDELKIALESQIGSRDPNKIHSSDEEEISEEEIIEEINSVIKNTEDLYERVEKLYDIDLFKLKREKSVARDKINYYLEFILESNLLESNLESKYGSYSDFIDIIKIVLHRFIDLIKIVLHRSYAMEENWRKSIKYIEPEPTEEELKNFHKDCHKYNIQKNTEAYYKNFVLYFTECDCVCDKIYREAQVIPRITVEE